MRRHQRFVLLGSVLLGCSSSSTVHPLEPSPVATEARSQQSRDTAPAVAATDAAALVTGNDDFAFSLYHQLRGEHPDDNLVYSPYSISLATSMAYAGATNQAASEMTSALDFTLPAATLFPAFDGLDLGIAAAARGTDGADGAPFDLAIANSVWADKGLSVVPAYLDTMAADYGAGLEQADFASDPDAARTEINDWVNEKTSGKIPDLLGAGSVTQRTRLLLVNAIHFDAAWAYPFDPEATETRTFTHADGSTDDVATMQKTDQLPYALLNGVQAVELAYSGGGESMIVMIPDAAHADGFDAAFDTASYTALVSALAVTRVELELPKFTLEGATIDLTQELQALGMKTAFDCTVTDSFEGISATPLCITGVFHQTSASIDEDGTEAAAATGVEGSEAGVVVVSPPAPIPVHADHPFAIAIRDVASGTLLFLGKITSPGS